MVFVKAIVSHKYVSLKISKSTTEWRNIKFCFLFFRLSWEKVLKVSIHFGVIGWIKPV